MRKLFIATAAVLILSSACFANTLVYQAVLNGTNQNPPNASPATGFTEITIDTGLDTMRVQISFSDLVAPATASHIHCCIAPPGNVGVATTTPSFPGFPNATSGTYDHTFDLTNPSSYNGAFVTANGGTAASAEAALLAGLAAGDAYLNIHDATFPGGEIRGFLVLATPEPSSLALLGAAVPGLLLIRRRKK